MSKVPDAPESLAGHLLVAMPQMADPRFARSVIYLCAHSAEGAMGLVVNRTLDTVTFPGLLEQLGIDSPAEANEQVHFGGPVESSRGFVLHSADVVQEASLVITDDFALTATLDILRAIAKGEGPRQHVLALGYAGWAPGQLDTEIQENGWLLVPADADIVFSRDNDNKYTRALAKIGVDVHLLSSQAGHA
ncbi:YqgE/AlgH family protein [Marinivivus vitaminiproducens]|uniref:YqgE/AlgH family protein n=1 Tax=Marinivivus vitaminiproducens TaxID=3035935 RepID=UPI003F9F8D08